MSALAWSDPEAVLLRLAHASGQAAVLGLLVGIGLGVLRGRLEARWRFALWLVVLVRLALPMVPTVPWSLFRLTPAPFASVAESPIAAPIPALPRLDPGEAEQRDREPAAVAALPPSVAPDPPGDAVIAPRPWTWVDRLAAVWLAGVLLLFVRHGWLHRQLRRQRRTWRMVVDPAVLDLFHRCRQELGVRRLVRLRKAADGCGPAACDTVRATIVLPERLLAQLPAEELRLVLLHELTHVRRWDVLLDRAAVLVAMLHWFNPIAWLALAGLRRERESACDEAVLRHVGAAQSVPYGHTLLKVAGRLSVPAPLAGVVGVFGKDRSLVRRIHMIANYRKQTVTGTNLGACLLVLLTAFGLTDAAVAPAHPAGESSDLAEAMAEGGETCTIAGVCKDEAGKPLAGVRVVLYRDDPGALKAEQLRVESTGADGRFQFRDLPAPQTEKGRQTWGYGVVMTKPGRGSIVVNLAADQPPEACRFTLRPAATLQGRVTDASGKPVGGATVWHSSLMSGPVDGVCSTRTDADGRYAITDMGAWGEDVTRPRPAGNGAMTAVSGCYFDVLHPNFAHERPMYHRMPDTVDVVLQPGGILTGRVVDQVTGRPAAGVMVCLQGIDESKGGPKGGGWQQIRTDANGTYRFDALIPAKYNLWADAPERACAALDSLAVKAATTHTAPDLLLIEGGWIEGRLVDAETRRPIDGTKDRRLRVASYGPGRPRSGAACQSSEVDAHGRFRLHVAPGVNYPYIMQWDLWERTQRREYFQQGIEVISGEVASVEFRILPAKPLADPAPAPVRLPVPVPAERAAAALIRQLGGWYVVDAENHVIEVNMVYHETLEQRRYDNDRTDTDEALRAVSAFPRLQRLFLKGGQATDDGLRSLTPLRDVEILYVWDAERITDAGVAHLAGLMTLKSLHFSNGRLGDGSLEVFGGLPALERLSLQGNAFSDEGLKHLARLPRLHSLWIGMNRRPITDAGARNLLGLAQLQELDLQRSQVSKAFLERLKEQRPALRLYHSDSADGK
jgi:beta-lactamase regulating signal transducer with metallopeptidase domain/5-hydroxyisourate hydrolase-like protein (transthyretin family)